MQTVCTLRSMAASIFASVRFASFLVALSGSLNKHYSWSQLCEYITHFIVRQGIRRDAHFSVAISAHRHVSTAKSRNA